MADQYIVAVVLLPEKERTQVLFSEHSLHCTLDLTAIDKTEFMKAMSIIADWMLERIPRERLNA